jgi:DNA-binding NarL/FixJ family response regulator
MATKSFSSRAPGLGGEFSVAATCRSRDAPPTEAELGKPPPDTAQGLIRVFVVADHAVVRVGIQMMLAPVLDIDIVGEGSASLDVLGTVAAIGPHVVIIDPDADRDTEIRLVPRLQQAAPSSRFLVLTGLRSPEWHQAAIRSGAQGLVLKDAPLDVLVKAIRRVHSGELWFERVVLASAVADHAVTGLQDVHRRQIASLTARERDVIELIGEGFRNEQIAAHLGVAEKTVRNHLSTVFDKLGVNDRLGLAVYAYQHGLTRSRA